MCISKRAFDLRLLTICIWKMTDQIYYMTVRVKYDQGTVRKCILHNNKYSICMTIYTHTCMVSYINYTRQPNFQYNIIN